MVSGCWLASPPPYISHRDMCPSEGHGQRSWGLGRRGRRALPSRLGKPVLCARVAAEHRPPPLQNGVMSGLMQMLLLKVSAHITEQLGMAPGGEFREAFKEVGLGSAGRRGARELPGAQASPANTSPRPQASKVPFCKFHLGDRPIPVTFKRAIAALSFWQKVKLAWGLCFLSDPIR